MARNAACLSGLILIGSALAVAHYMFHLDPVSVSAGYGTCLLAVAWIEITK